MIGKYFRSDSKNRRLPKVSLFFFNRPKLTLLLWLGLFGFGALSYSTFMQRQGFPAVQAPFSIVSGAYFVDDSKVVDQKVAKPISDIALKQDKVKTVTAQSSTNTFSIFIQYKDGTEPKAANSKLQTDVVASGILPAEAKVSFQTIDVSKYTPKDESFDLIIAFFDKSGIATDELNVKAQTYTKKLNDKKLSLVDNAKVISPFSEGVNPQTGESQSVQTSFDRYGQLSDGKISFYNDVAIGLTAKPEYDTVKLYNQVSQALAELNQDSDFNGSSAVVSASFAPEIIREVNELQKTLIEGLIAVLLVGSVLIALRASLLVIVSMLSVLAITVGVVFLVGYTLNVIILFSLILSLSLIVDDTIIITEALDAERRRQKNAKAVVERAVNKVSLAMVAATSTAVLGFAPIIFISGILGGFIRPIPITIAIALTTSLVVALVLIPFFARFLILRKKDIGSDSKNPLPVRLQESFAKQLTRPLRWAKNSGKRLTILGAGALIISMSFIFGGAYLFKYVTFNIFPADKDANQLTISVNFPNNTDISGAEAIADKIDGIIASALGNNLTRLTYYSTGNQQSGQIFIELIPYDQREVRAPQLVDQLKDKFKDFNDANLTIAQQGAGGPPGVFSVLIETPNREAATLLAQDMADFLRSKELKRLDGSVAEITQAQISNDDTWLRKNGKEIVQVTAMFDGTDTSTLVNLAKSLVDKNYTEQKLSTYNLKKENVVYDFGFEAENQESFNSMILAFPILIALMYLLLALEFKSLLQPLLIFMALPFSFLGVTGGLWLTDNPFSFFTLLGMFALIGLSIKNTILLVDYANQGRRAGLGRVDAIADALEERFRPLLATSVTAVFSLLPLALTSPFWESLAFTLIFGLISSTTLVLLVFPYYYLGGEYLRAHISRKQFFKWLAINLLLAALFGLLTKNSGVGIAAIVGYNLGLAFRRKFKR